MGTHWNLRRVKVGPKRPKIFEVFYEDGRPWAFADARLIDTIRFFADWHDTPILRHPEDFVGEPDWLKDFDRMVEDAMEEEKQ